MGDEYIPFAWLGIVDTVDVVYPWQDGSERRDLSEREKLYLGMPEIEESFDVRCINNLGLESSFDQGITYVAFKHTEKGMLLVYDKDGIKREVMKERFEA